MVPLCIIFSSLLRSNVSCSKEKKKHLNSRSFIIQAVGIGEKGTDDEVGWEKGSYGGDEGKGGEPGERKADRRGCRLSSLEKARLPHTHINPPVKTQANY